MGLFRALGRVGLVWLVRFGRTLGLGGPLRIVVAVGLATLRLGCLARLGARLAGLRCVGAPVVAVPKRRKVHLAGLLIPLVGAVAISAVPILTILIGTIPVGSILICTIAIRTVRAVTICRSWTVSVAGAVGLVRLFGPLVVTSLPAIALELGLRRGRCVAGCQLRQGLLGILTVGVGPARVCLAVTMGIAAVRDLRPRSLLLLGLRLEAQHVLRAPRLVQLGVALVLTPICAVVAPVFPLICAIIALVFAPLCCVVAPVFPAFHHGADRLIGPGRSGYQRDGGPRELVSAHADKRALHGARAGEVVGRDDAGKAAVHPHLPLLVLS